LLELAAYLAIGAASGLLAGLFGVGGGVIVVPALILLFSHTGQTGQLGPITPGEIGMAAEWIPHLAIGTSLAAIVGTGAASTHAHHRRGAVRWDLVARLAPGIILGALFGAALAGVMPELWLKRIFAVFLTYVGARMLIPRKAHRDGTLPGSAGMWTAGGGIGTLSALVGIGGGTLTVPFLSNRGIDMRNAVGTSAACGLPIAIAGAIGFMIVGWGREGLPSGSSGFIYWPAVGAILLASMPTAPLGAHLAHSLPVPLLTRLFGVFLLLVALRLATG
jgi:uncharacterized membrane protein YfcA